MELNQIIQLECFFLNIWSHEYKLDISCVLDVFINGLM